jgi:hypothetical protein
VGVHPQGGKFSPLPIRIIAYCIPAIACCILPSSLRTYSTREKVKRTEELPGQDFVRRNRDPRRMTIEEKGLEKWKKLAAC